MIKKIILISILLLCIVQLALAIEKPINVDVNDSTWVPVSLYAGTDSKSYVVQARTGKIVLISDSVVNGEAGIYWTIKEDGGLSLDDIMAVRGGVLFYAKTQDGTGVEVLELVRLKYRDDL